MFEDRGCAHGFTNKCEQCELILYPLWMRTMAKHGKEYMLRDNILYDHHGYGIAPTNYSDFWPDNGLPKEYVRVPPIFGGDIARLLMLYGFSVVNHYGYPCHSNAYGLNDPKYKFTLWIHGPYQNTDEGQLGSNGEFGDFKVTAKQFLEEHPYAGYWYVKRAFENTLFMNSGGKLVRYMHGHTQNWYSDINELGIGCLIPRIMSSKTAKYVRGAVLRGGRRLYAHFPSGYLYSQELEWKVPYIIGE